MRLHQLTVTAFGPFAGREQVDFDALSTGGLFLLRGATGAGKSSVLDAVCYALYGELPGTRKANRMRSDHAEPDRLTEVRLELTLGGRRLEITRIPEQRRPKKRGTGWTLEKAQTLLREWTADAGEGVPGWRAGSRSHQETGEEILRLIGMSREQFCQVVLLPQGDFARFLKADATHRGELLGKLFDTARFGRVEGWLAERRRQQEAAVQAGRRRLRELVSRTGQAAGPGAEPAAEWIPAEGEAGAADGELAAAALGWAAVLRSGAAERLAVAESALAGAEQRQRAAQRALSQAEELAGRQRRHREALGQAAELAKSEEQDAADRQRLTLAQAALGVESALRLRATAADGHRRARAAEQEQRRLLAAVSDLPDAAVAELTAAEAAVREAIGRLKSAADDERRCTELAAEERTEAADRRAAEELAEEAEGWLAGYQAESDALTEQEAAARAAATRTEQLDARRIETQARLEAARRRDALRARAAEAETGQLVLHEAALQAKEYTLELRRRRLDGMAAELAGRLRAGEACRVCGSAAHPAPAVPSGAPVGPQDEERAAGVQQSAERALATARDELTQVQVEAATAAGTAGEEPVAELAEQLTVLTREHRAARQAAEQLTLLLQRRERLEQGQQHYSTQLHHGRERVAARTARLETLAAERQELSQRVAAARGDAPSVAERASGLDRLAGRLGAAAAAGRAAAESADRLAQAEAELTRAARAAGFGTPQEAEAVRLSDERQAQLRHHLERRAAERSAVTGLLADAELVAAAARPPADPAGAQGALRAATERLTLASAAEHSARTRCAELAGLGRQLTGLARELAPLLAEFGQITRLSQLAGGTGGDNRLKMRLESYVLAARLEQVAAAASARLVRMSGGRYTLVHSDERTAGGRRSGLSLLVVDAWTGTERDTATLSGGEGFFASLALALGLADVVTDEAGGMPLDTLFIDEGFGTLDEQALEEVMDVLDGLRERDRAVGIVSHVADLRQRIPAQLLVRKGRHGSTLQLTGPEAG
ncbi:exonuclease SbcC [Kitasatospora sp. MAP12-15]|uniref:SMC family ATPase n=1 Tax=unclassified Kitasatospora TaxID=2633591 RepID=UPI00247550F0|nr:SMC family ATPase [Kitasatospora sp. MAP12-44]MDH6114053.1 exonuclease SbcC [Kitasatospora sp. MAP12-44]